MAYVGAMRALEQRGILASIERVGGTSAGAINAVLVGLGYSVADTQEILGKLDFKNFLDDSWGVFRDTDRLVKEFGWYRGDFFREWVAGVIKEKTGNRESTFAEVEGMRQGSHPEFRSLYFMGTNLSTGFSEVFSCEHTPRMCVADAVRISMSIPLFFAAKHSARGDVYVDGGVLDNYPIKLFDRKKYLSDSGQGRVTEYYDKVNSTIGALPNPISPYVFNKETLGFRLDSKKEGSVFRDQAEPPHRKIGDFFDYAAALVDTVLGAQQNTHLHSDDWQRTIYIDTLGVGTTDFSLSDQKKLALVVSGQAGVDKYFQWYDVAPDAANK